MAKKTKKQKQRSPTRRPSGTPVPARSGARVTEAPAPAPVANIPPDEAPAVAPDQAAASVRRRVERVDPATVRPQPRGRQTRSRFAGTSAALVAPLDSDDPAIPFDRVPYVPADLRRVAIIAVIMIVIIIVAGLITTRLVT